MMQSAYLWLILHVKHKKKTFISALTWFLISKIQDVGQDESIKTWEKHMCREARAETTVTNAWSWILIGSENEGRYASWSGSEATNKWRCQSTHQTLIFILNINTLLQFCR